MVGSDFLNVDFFFNYGGVKPHAINLVKIPSLPHLMTEKFIWNSGTILIKA